MRSDETTLTRDLVAPGGTRPGTRTEPSAPRAAAVRRASRWRLVRLGLSWTLAVALMVIGLPHVVGVSWHVVVPVFTSLRWPAVVALLAVWFLGKYAHSFLLTAAAPGLTRPRAVAVNLTGSAVASVMPLGGAAGLEMNRRMMRTWDVEGRGFAGYAFLVNLWGIGCKLLLPVIAVTVLAAERERVGAALQATAFSTTVTFVGLAIGVALLLGNPACARTVGTALDRTVGLGLRMAGRPYEPRIADAFTGIRSDCGRLVAIGWWRMSLGAVGYAAFQCLLLAMCLHLTGAGNTIPEVLAGFAVERTLTILPITPGGMGVGDLGLVGTLLALGGNPAGVAGAAVLFRTFTFAVEVPVGACLLGMWFLQRRVGPAQPPEVMPSGSGSPASR